MISNNPLKQYFRQPAIYLRLPSQGQHYPMGAINMTVSGEIPIFPMTAIDEITYRTPDALFNGTAVVNVIQSCVPNIVDPWAIPSIDVDAILVAIRIASYGHNMEIETGCPGCKSTNTYGLDLRSVLDQLKSADYSAPLEHGDLLINFKPMNYKNLNDNNQAQFEEQKIMQILPNTEIPESEKVTRLGEALKKITDITVSALAQSIASVKTPDAIVTETEYIEEMLKNCDRILFNQIRDHIINIKSDSEIKPLKIICPDCSFEYEQPITLDMVSFFGLAS